MNAALSAPAVRARRFTPSATLVLVLLAVGVGIALRVFVYVSVLGQTQSDESVLGLMARHALHGQFTTFLWGTPYGGPQEAWLATPIFAVFGSSVAALRVVPIALDIAGVLLIWRVGLRTIGERPALIAAALCWIWPPETMMLAIKEIGFYASNTFYCALVLLLVLRAYERTYASPVLAMALGLRLPAGQAWQAPYGIAALAFIAAVVLFFVGAYFARGRPASLLYAVCLVYPFVMMISPRSYGTIDPHYLSTLMPVFALLVAQLARTVVAAALVLLAAAAITFGWVHDSYEKLQTSAPDKSTTPRSIAPLIDTLDDLHVNRVFTDYWIAYRLAFESDERIIAVENKFDRTTVRHGVVEPGPDPFVRYAEYERLVRASKRPAFVFLRRYQPKGTLVPTLVAHGY